MSLGGGKGGNKSALTAKQKKLPKKQWEWELLAVEYLDCFDVAKILPSVEHWNAFLDGWFNGAPASLRGYQFPEIAHAGALARHIFVNARRDQLQAILNRHGAALV